MNRNPLKQFASGFFYPYHAVRFLKKNPRLFKFIAIPFLINALVFSLTVFLGFHFFSNVVVGQIPTGEAWYWLLLYYFLWIIAVAVTAVLVFFTFTVVGNLIASPFNELLSERTEEILTGAAREESFSFREFWRDSLRTLKEESKKMSLFVLGMLSLLVLNFIPIAGTAVYGVLSVLFTLFFLSIEYTGYIVGRYRWTFKAQRKFIARRRFLMMGFSCGLLLLLVIPFVQFLCIPLGVIGATQLWCDHGEEVGL